MFHADERTFRRPSSSLGRPAGVFIPKLPVALMSAASSLVLASPCFGPDIPQGQLLFRLRVALAAKTVRQLCSICAMSKRVWLSD